ncbi:MAG: hypothetical protein AABX85_03985 [Nanoarchaeota archaeon]
MLNNKKAEKYLSIWWFFVLAMIAMGIVAGVLIFYGADVNVKGLEAEILSGRLYECLESNGFILDKFLLNDFNLFLQCNIAKEVFGPDDEYYLRISISDISGKKMREDIIAGNVPYEKDCLVEKSLVAKNYPKCVVSNKEILFFDGKEVKPVKLEIIIASNQLGKRGATN